MKINEKIRQLREQHQLSQENMADKLGMSVTGYGKIERGEVRSNLSRLEQISEVFDMDICELLSVGETEKVYFNNSSHESTNSNNSNHFLFAVGNDNLEKVIQQLHLKNFATAATRNISSYLWKTTQIYTIISALRIAIFLRKRCRICRKWREAYVKKRI